MAFLSRHLKRFLSFAGALVLSCAMSAAEPMVARTFSVLAGGHGDWADFGVLRGSTFVPLTPARQTRSPALPMPTGESRLTFVRRTLDAATGRTIDVPLARAEWPGDAKRALFVLIPSNAADGSPALDVVACNDGLDAFPAESIRVVNTTQATFQGLLGRERMTFAPGASAPVATTAFIPPDEDAPDPGMPVGLALPTNSGPKTLYAATMSVSPRSRVLVLVCPPKTPGSQRLQVRAIHDVPALPIAGTPIAVNRR